MRQARSTAHALAAAVIVGSLPEIKAKSLALVHVPIIDPHPRNVPGGKETIAAEARGRRKAGYTLAEDVRYNERGIHFC